MDGLKSFIREEADARGWTLGQTYEWFAKQAGFKDWNTCCAAIKNGNFFYSLPRKDK